MGQIQWTISLVMVALFSIAVLGYAINFAIDNDSPVDISDNPRLSAVYSNTSSNLSTFRGEAQSSYISILNTTIPAGSQTAQSSGPFAITFSNMIGVVTNILSVGYTEIFGSGSGFGIFLFSLLGLIVLITALSLWKTLAGRTPD